MQNFNNPNIWDLPDKAKPDYELDCQNRNRRPTGRCKPIHFPKKGQPARFHKFLWDLVNQYHRINLALAYYKSSRIAGAMPDVAEQPYRDARDFYRDKFYKRWKSELDNPTTHIDPVISSDGYILDVRVVSKAFSERKPGESSSETVVYPYPSSSSQRPKP